jgi:hypothetical protein
MTKLRMAAAGIKAIWVAMALFQWTRLIVFRYRLNKSFQKTIDRTDVVLDVAHLQNLM